MPMTKHSTPHDAGRRCHALPLSSAIRLRYHKGGLDLFGTARCSAS